MGVVNLARAVLPRNDWVAAAFVLGALGLATARAEADAPPAPGAPTPPLAEQLRAAVRAAALGDTVGISIVDLRSGVESFAQRAGLPLNPASNMKLLTAATALVELGPEFRFQTGLYGRVVDGAVQGGLCLRGRGDPTLRRADLMLFAQRAYEEGARRVDEVIIDGSYFDDQVLPPLFEQQPSETAPFRAAVGALSVKANAYTLRVRPGAGEGAPALAQVDGSGYFELESTLLTSSAAPLKVIAEERPSETGIVLSLSGSVPPGSGSLAFDRRVPAPLPYAGYLFADALRAAGITLPNRVNVSHCPSDLPLIHLAQSQPLAQVLDRLGKDSDNFVAEMVLKVIAGEHDSGEPATSSAGAAIVVETLKQLGVATDGLVVRNGSGLFKGNRVTAGQLTGVLAAMYASPALRDEFVSQLAVGGVDGTLARRFKKLPRPRIVRAKTGTLDDTIALSGYVLGPTPDRAYAFSYLANSVAGKHTQARALIDQLVAILAATLYP